MIEHKWAAFEVKEGDAGIISGYAATYQRDSDGDRFHPGAFAGSVRDRKGKVPIFLHHDRALWAGVSTSLAEDHKGLYLEAQLFLDTTAGREAWGVIKGSRAVDAPLGLSVGFITLDQDWEDSTNTRIIKEADLWETSITPFPANKGARIDEAKTKAIRNYERLTRDVCKCSAADAKRLLAMLPLAFSGDPEDNSLTPARDVRGMKQLDYGGALEALRVLKEALHA